MTPRDNGPSRNPDESVDNEVAALMASLERTLQGARDDHRCSCVSWPPEGPDRDCLVHGCYWQFHEASGDGNDRCPRCGSTFKRDEETS